MKVFHLSLHNGCIEDQKYVHSQLGNEVQSRWYDDGYSIGHARAAKSWQKMKDVMNSVDVVFTSDIAPLSRIVLQHIDEFKGNLVIWICNRFDVCDVRTNDCGFPDPEYYDLFRMGIKHPRVRVVSYTEFEYEFAKRKGCQLADTLTIKPVGIFPEQPFQSLMPDGLVREQCFFIPDYHNDKYFMDLCSKCGELGIKAHRGRYAGYKDLIGFKGIIHNPYAWSNFAFFENIQAGLVYFIPSIDFVKHLSTLGNFFWSPPFDKSCLEMSEWYHQNHKDFIVYFDSWDDLREKVKMDLTKIKERQKEFCEHHKKLTLDQWRAVYAGFGKV